LTVQMWLTQRLLSRLLVHLLDTLNQGAAGAGSAGSNLQAGIMQSFSQQAARAQLRAQPAVKPASDNLQWLVSSVDIKGRNPAAAPQEASPLALVFKGDADEQAAVVFATG